MGGRYFITGVQLGILRAFSEGSFREEKRNIFELIDGIINNQFLGNIEDFKNPRIMIQECQTKENKIWTTQQVDEYLSRILKILLPLIEESIGD